ncbi:jg3321 [Pararge aegeria aegeria]|uniref:Jg3321 protein n=1 Tax=Pararge aegeria aegeria TaxID=348720 RepID=A0A8S4RTT1_9NEOP|nr:jg3321 [Pararge aegeria aegeria]
MITNLAHSRKPLVGLKNPPLPPSTPCRSGERSSRRDSRGVHMARYGRAGLRRTLLAHSLTTHTRLHIISSRSTSHRSRAVPEPRVEVRGAARSALYCATCDVDGGRARARSRAQPSLPRALTL